MALTFQQLCDPRARMFAIISSSSLDDKHDIKNLTTEKKKKSLKDCYGSEQSQKRKEIQDSADPICSWGCCFALVKSECQLMQFATGSVLPIAKTFVLVVCKTHEA